MTSGPNPQGHAHLVELNDRPLEPPLDAKPDPHWRVVAICRCRYNLPINDGTHTHA